METYVAAYIAWKGRQLCLVWDLVEEGLATGATPTEDDD